MKTITYHRDETDGPSLRKLTVMAVLIGACFSVPGVSWAQQAESTAICDEAGVPPIAEPVPMVYGDSTDGCVISPATESDSFRFDGTTGDLIRLNLLGQTNGFDPIVEVRDNMNSLIGSGSCVAPASFLTCSFSTDVVLAVDGTHTLSVSDQGGNEVGNYTLQLERILPGLNIERLSYDSLAVVDGRVTTFIDESSVVDGISPATDVDHYYFTGVAGTTIRFNVLGRTDGFDPAIEVRDPTGTRVLNGQSDGAGCISAASFLTCSFSVDLSPSVTGTYTVLLSDINNDESGAFQFSLWCVFGDCDNDGDGIPDVRPKNLRYGESVTTDSVSPEVDGDLFTFMATPVDVIRFTVLGQTDGFDPAIQVRDPAGMRVLNGEADGAGCTAAASFLTCSFTVDLAPTLMGAYTVVLYDQGTDELGDYDLTLGCVFSPDDLACENLPGRFPTDVLEDHFAFAFIETLADKGITSGCAPDSYCPSDSITRAQMAVFMERGLNGGNFQPPECTGTVFDDVSSSNFACAFIEQFAMDGITSGCGPDIFCPNDPVTRAQMAVFLLRAEHGAGFTPPAATGIFTDAPLGSFAVDWIEQLAAEGITVGCGGGNYCPNDAVTRAQMAVFLVRTFALGE